MKVKIKVITDIGMLILILLQMAYHLVGDSLHMWMGILLYILVIVHNILNRKWYFGLGKGKYTLIRFFHTAANMMLIVSFLGLAVSTIFLSSTLSALFRLKATLLGRRMHMVFSAWSFIMVSAHVGQHWSRIDNAVRKQAKKIQCLYRIVVVCVSVYGVYVFLSEELLQRMFFLVEYAFFDYKESVFNCVANYFSVLCLFSSLSFCATKLVSAQKIYKRNEQK